MEDSPIREVTQVKKVTKAVLKAPKYDQASFIGLDGGIVAWMKRDSELSGLNKQQFNVSTYLGRDSPSRGLLAYHELGSGKTVAAIATLANNTHYDEMYIMLPASLRENFKNGFKEYKKFTHVDVLSFIEKEQKPKLTYVNYNGLTRDRANKLAQKLREDKPRIVIIDEAHNFIRTVSSSKLSVLSPIYEALLSQSRTKILALSGSPCINHPVELAFLFNLLRGPTPFHVLRFSSSMFKTLNESRSELADFVDSTLSIRYARLDYESHSLFIQRAEPGFACSGGSFDIAQRESTPLDEYVYRSEEKECNPKFSNDQWVRGLKSKFEKTFPRIAINQIELKTNLALPFESETAFEDEFVDMSEFGELSIRGDLFGSRCIGLVSRVKDIPEVVAKMPRYEDEKERYILLEERIVHERSLVAVQTRAYNRVYEDAFKTWWKHGTVPKETHVRIVLLESCGLVSTNNIDDTLNNYRIKCTDVIRSLQNDSKDPILLSCASEHYIGSHADAIRYDTVQREVAGIPMDVMYLTFGSEQYTQYEQCRLMESNLERQSRKSNNKEKSEPSLYKTYSRQACNAYNPPRQQDNSSKRLVDLVQLRSDQIVQENHMKSRLHRARLEIIRRRAFDKEVESSTIETIDSSIGSLVHSLYITKKDFAIKDVTDELLRVHPNIRIEKRQTKKWIKKRVIQEFIKIDEKAPVPDILNDIDDKDEQDELDYRSHRHRLDRDHRTHLDMESFIENYEETDANKQNEELNLLGTNQLPPFPVNQSAGSEQNTKMELSEYSPKFERLLSYLLQDRSKTIIYSTYKNKHTGTDAFCDILEVVGYERWKPEDVLQDDEADDKAYENSENMTRKPRYVKYDGSVPEEERKQILLAFNDQTNKRGERIEVIVITAAAAEGISFKSVRRIHIMEPHWNITRLHQVCGRARRQNSHEDLDASEQSIRVFLYAMSFRSDVGASQSALVRRDGMQTTDEVLFEIALRKDFLNRAFLNLLERVAIDRNMYDFIPRIEYDPSIYRVFGRRHIYDPDYARHKQSRTITSAKITTTKFIPKIVPLDVEEWPESLRGKKVYKVNAKSRCLIYTRERPLPRLLGEIIANRFVHVE